MTDDDLQGRFDELDDVEVPPWRERTEARLAVPASTSVAAPRSSLPMLVAAAAVVVALIAAGGLLTGGDPDDDAVVADDGGPSAPPAPVPLDDRSLACPPALLDISRLDAQPTLAPATGDGFTEHSEPYVLTWQQGGVDVLLSYPGPFLRTSDLPLNETVTLSDGRSARLEFRADTTADVPPPNGDPCSGFWISVPGDERDAVVAIAEQVAIRVPEGSTVVPDVVGLGPREAQDAIARAGLVPSGASIDPFPIEPVEPVATQSPPPGTEVAIGSDVDLVYEPPPTTTAPPVLDDPDVTVPIPE